MPAILSPSRPAHWLALGFALCFPTFVTWLYFIALHGASPALQQGAYTVGKGIQFLFPLVWVFALRSLYAGHQLHNDRRVLTLRDRLRGVPLGIAFGLVVSAAALALYFAYLKPAGIFAAAGEEVREKVAGMGLSSPLVFCAMAVFYSLIHSGLEEYYWRWFVFGELQKLTPPTAAIVISSLGFMAHHVLVLAKFFGPASPATYLLAASVAIGGAVWAWLYRQSGSLVGPWISHAIIDAMIFAIGYDLMAR